MTPHRRRPGQDQPLAGGPSFSWPANLRHAAGLKASTVHADLGRDHVHLDHRPFGHIGQVDQLIVHDLRAADPAPQHALVDDRPERRRLGPSRPGRDYMTSLPPPEEAARLTRFLCEHPWWSAFWDKRHGVWRVAEDDPDSSLCAEVAEADAVIRYMTAHS